MHGLQRIAAPRADGGGGRRALPLLPAAVLLLAAAACGDDDGGRTTSTGTPSGASSGAGGAGEPSSAAGSAAGGAGSGGGEAGAGGGAGGAGGGGAHDTSQDVFVWTSHQIVRLTRPGHVPTTIFENVDLGTADAQLTSVAASPDGSQLAVALREYGLPTAEARILVVPVASGGPARTIHHHDPDKYVDFRRLRWSDDGRWLGFLAGIPAGDEPVAEDTVFVVSTDGGSIRRVTPTLPPPGETNGSDMFIDLAFAPGASPEGTYIASFKQHEEFFDGGIWVAGLEPGDTGIAHVLDRDHAGAAPQWDALGRVYSIGHDEVSGRMVVHRAATDGSSVEQVPGLASLANEEGLAEVPAFGISPDGTRLAVAADAPRADEHQVHVLPVDGGAPTQVTAMVGRRFNFGRIVWSPDGAHLAFVADDASTSEAGLYVARTDGAGAVRVLAGDLLDRAQWAFSRDATHLYVSQGARLHVTSDFSTADQSWEETRVEGVELQSGVASATGLTFPGTDLTFD